MKKILIILTAFMLSACNDNFVKQKFPDVLEDLKVSCPALQQVDPKTEKLSTVVESVVVNYSTYYECKVKVDAWIDWYNTQKTIHDNVK